MSYECPWVPREYCGHGRKLRRYNGLRNGNEERRHNFFCVGSQGLNFGCMICARERPIFLQPSFMEEKCMKVNLQVLQT
jgi:hypothetical protein